MDALDPLAEFAETRRLQSLASFEVLDTPPEADFDDVVELIAAICRTPMAAITLIDRDRQWFKAKIGFAMDHSPRSIAFCAHTILHGHAMVVHDACADPRFADNPLVTADPHIRFYAGYPLVTSEGAALGALAVMDRVPRTLNPQQLVALQVLARRVVESLELRRGVQQLSAMSAERDRALERLAQAKFALEEQVADQAVALERAIAEHVASERMYRTLWETTTDAVLVVDARNVITFANPSTATLFGRRPEDLVGQPLSLLQPKHLRAGHLEGMRRFLETGVRRLDWRAVETLALRVTGEMFPVEISFTAMSIGDEDCFVGFFRDITERKHAEKALFDQKERAQAILRSIADGVVVFDENGFITFMNPLAAHLTGWPESEACGRPNGEVLQFSSQDGDEVMVQGPLSADVDAPVPLSATPLLLQPRDSAAISIEGSISRLRDQTGRTAGSVVAFRDVSRWRRMAAQLSYQATHDSLTGLVNRSEFERRVQSVVDRGSDQSDVHSLLYLDVDHFNLVNDTFGHVAGDQLLKQMTNALRMQLRNSDTLARLGGDEFGVLLEKCPAENAVQVAEKLRNGVADFVFSWEGNPFELAVSVGLVCFGSDSMSLTEVLSKADEACYVAKDLGRNRVHLYEPGDEELKRRHGEMEWVGLIRRALKEDRFVLYSQKIFDLRHPEKPPHLEVLLRMVDAKGQLIPPMTFIPAAERYNLMPTLDRWVIARVCRYVGERIRASDSACNHNYGINLSGASVTDVSLVDFIREQLREHGVSGECICFEVTETAAIGNLAFAVKLIRDLKEMGCRFALDDFGSGMSSFAYLKHLPVDFLKIDGGFVRDIADDPIDRAMVSAINEIGHVMGLQTVAEFVENDRILAELREIGVDYGQGYGLARPEPFL